MDAGKDVSRRQFFRTSAGGAASLVIGFYLPGRSVLARTLAQEAPAAAAPKLPSPNA
jgi:hypothetical protein